MNVAQLVARYPRLYHMAEADAWPSLQRHGLLSTNEIVRRAGLSRSEAVALRSAHRPDKVRVSVPGIGEIILRDQKPMAANRLEKILEDGLTSRDWYELINSRVFLWVRQERLMGLLNAREYRHLEHDVLTIDTSSLLKTHALRVWLCPINSGNTFPFPRARGRRTFERITDYPVTARGKPVKEVVELTVEDHVLDLADHVSEVRRMKGGSLLRSVYVR
jgi:hypothetical protein